MIFNCIRNLIFSEDNWCKTGIKGRGEKATRKQTFAELYVRQTATAEHQQRLASKNPEFGPVVEEHHFGTEAAQPTPQIPTCATRSRPQFCS